MFNFRHTIPLKIHLQGLKNSYNREQCIFGVLKLQIKYRKLQRHTEQPQETGRSVCWSADTLDPTSSPPVWTGLCHLLLLKKHLAFIRAGYVKPVGKIYHHPHFGQDNLGNLFL